MRSSPGCVAVQTLGLDDAERVEVLAHYFENGEPEMTTTWSKVFAHQALTEVEATDALWISTLEGDREREEPVLPVGGRHVIALFAGQAPDYADDEDPQEWHKLVAWPAS